MDLSLHKTRSVTQFHVLQKNHDKSLITLTKYQKQLISHSQILDSKQPLEIPSTNQKITNLNISIYDSKEQVKNSSKRQNHRFSSSKQNQNKFYSFFMQQSPLQTYQNFSLDQNFNKQNEMNSSNYNSLHFLSQSMERNQIFEDKKIFLNEKLDQSYNRAIKNKNKLEYLEKQNIMDEETSGKRIKLIERLIGMLETNKNVRICEMFEQRQRLSETREQEKKQCQRTLDKIKEIEGQMKSRKIDEPTAMSEVNKLRV